MVLCMYVRSVMTLAACIRTITLVASKVGKKREVPTWSLEIRSGLVR